MKELSEQQWDELRIKLEAPFPPESIDFRVMRKQGNRWSVAAYLDKVAVINRLNEVVGMGNWEYDFHYIVIDNINQKIQDFDQGGKPVQTVGTYAEMTKAKGEMTIHGVTRCGLGTMSNTEFSKGCDSDTFKRSAVLFGIGAYLYDLPKMFVEGNAVNYGQIDPRVVMQLREGLPVPEGYVKPVRQAKQQGVRQVDLEDDVRRPAQSAPQSRRQQQTPVNGGATQAPNPRVAALNDYNEAKADMGFSLGEEFEPIEREKIGLFLKRGPAPVDRLTPQQLEKATAAIREGVITPW